MSLSREQAEANGLRFSIDGEAHPADPDIEIYQADLTIDGHTERLAGKSEEDILAQVQVIFASRGKVLNEDADQDGDDEVLPDSDLHDARNANDDPVANV